MGPGHCWICCHRVLQQLLHALYRCCKLCCCGHLLARHFDALAMFAILRCLAAVVARTSLDLDRNACMVRTQSTRPSVGCLTTLVKHSTSREGCYRNRAHKITIEQAPLCWKLTCAALGQSTAVCDTPVNKRQHDKRMGQLNLRETFIGTGRLVFGAYPHTAARGLPQHRLSSLLLLHSIIVRTRQHSDAEYAYGCDDLIY